ncbi:transcriptional regulator [Streptomyces sp. NPDC001922]|uniref:transcriptional regulator n=1 Tax=Streptomyces sp. NPDC001922 TaxID=3364624 RepID=UPI0036988FB1
MPFDADDLPGYAGAIFDHLVAHPDLMRLITWKQLERPGAAETGTEAYRKKIAAVTAAQRTGRIDPAHDPADVLAMVLAVAQASFTTAVAPAATGSGTPWEGARLAAHRAAVTDAVRRFVAPGQEQRPGRDRSVAGDPLVPPPGGSR